MSEAQHLAQAIEQLFVSDAPAWFTPFAVATDGLSAEQAATSPAPRFNSIWAVVNHVRLNKSRCCNSRIGQWIKSP
jgi:hypothetical protein